MVYHYVIIFLLPDLSKVKFQGRYHRRRIRRRRFQVEPQTGFLDGLGRGRTKGSYKGAILFECRVVIEEGLDTKRAEKDDHIERGFHNRCNIVRYRAIKGGLNESYLVFDEVLRDVVLAVIRSWQYELFVIFMLADHLEQTIGSAIGRKEYFALAVQDKLLKVKCHRLSNAEVFHILRHLHFQLLTNAEKMVDCIAAVKDNGRVLGYIDTLFAELLTCKTFYTNKGMKLKLYIVLSCQFKIGGFIRIGTRLGDQNCVDLKFFFCRLFTCCTNCFGHI